MPPSLLLGLAALSAAHATPTAAHESPHASVESPHAAPGEARNIVAVRGLAGAAQHGDHARPMCGGGVFFERLLIPHTLEAEVAVNVLVGPNTTEVPVELLAKVPLHVGRSVEISPGIGGLLAFEGGSPRPTPGLIANADLYLWFDGDLAWLVELDGIALLSPGGPTAQIEAGSGLAVRF